MHSLARFFSLFSYRYLDHPRRSFSPPIPLRGGRDRYISWVLIPSIGQDGNSIPEIALFLRSIEF
jgi:hypothetical protein